MFRKSKIEPVEKVKIVERYLAGEIGIRPQRNANGHFLREFQRLTISYRSNNL